MKKDSSSPRIVTVAAEIYRIQTRRETINKRLGVIESEQLKLEDELADLKQSQHELELESSRLSASRF